MPKEQPSLRGIRGLWSRATGSKRSAKAANPTQQHQPEDDSGSADVPLPKPSGHIEPPPFMRPPVAAPKSSHDSLSPPALKPTLSRTLADKILAFRTISMFLGRLQHRNEIRINDTKKSQGLEPVRANNSLFIVLSLPLP